jgi:ribonuclease D
MVARSVMPLAVGSVSDEYRLPEYQMNGLEVPELVVTDERLCELCLIWLTLPSVALDTEFIRVSTFYPRPGLIQVCDDKGIYLLDPLVLTQWEGFKDILQAPTIVKVLHSCSEDLVVFERFFGCVPGPLFDTQKAAAFLGHGYSISYLNLVSALSGVTLTKGETRSDWLQRPLTDEQLKYAALDVAYLPEMYRELADALTTKQRMGWLQEECNRMRETASAIEDESQWPALYLAMGAAWRLNAQQLGVLKDLSLWREKQCRSRDKPRSWVARDVDLIQLAEKMPVDKAALRSIPEMSRNIYHQDADELLHIIRQASPVSDEVLCSVEGEPMSPEQRKQLKRCQQLVRMIAGRMGIAEELLARKKHLSMMVAGYGKPGFNWPADIDGWQRPLLEDELLNVLDS